MWWSRDRSCGSFLSFCFLDYYIELALALGSRKEIKASIRNESGNKHPDLINETSRQALKQPRSSCIVTRKQLQKKIQHPTGCLIVETASATHSRARPQNTARDDARQNGDQNNIENKPPWRYVTSYRPDDCVLIRTFCVTITSVTTREKEKSKWKEYIRLARSLLRFPYAGQTQWVLTLLE